MAKKKASQKKSSAPSRKALLRELGQIDRELLRLLTDRTRVVMDLNGDTSSANATAEEQVARNRGPLDDASVGRIFREIASSTQALAQARRIAYLGPKYSYSYLAAMEQFGEGADLVAVPSIAAVFEELDREHVNYGIVPLENSTDGRIVDTLGMFARLPVKICAEIPLAIHHQLLAKCDRSEVVEVYSKPQAISQCREWLANHLPNARIVEKASTTEAARLASETDYAAAIASRPAGLHYGLSVIAENIEDNRNNVTRFAVIGDHIGERTGQDKTAVMLELNHRPGALADVMGIFKTNRLNLTWIESFPMPESSQEYLFFLEIEGHSKDAKVRRAVKSLQEQAKRLEMLGSYPARETV